MEQKYGMGNEYGTLLWDVGKILDDISAFPKQKRSVYALVQENPFHGDAEYAMTTDISKPLVWIQLCEGKEKLIDGNHRLYKAKKEGIACITCYYLTVPQQQKYILDFNESIYMQIVNHLS
ncbi:MAG: hypothetical protein HFE86_02785 [Clostridiales bacterium]|nr:hypothetical protein [Clostridiales bacterium]